MIMNGRKGTELGFLFSDSLLQANEDSGVTDKV